MLKIRLRRMGKRHRPFYRVVVSDSRSVPTAPAVEELGHYDPMAKPPALKIDVDRIEHWVGHGALLTPTVKKLVKEIRTGRAAKAVEEAAAETQKKKTAEAEKKTAEKPEKAEAEPAEAAEEKPEAKADEPAKQAEASEKAEEPEKAEAEGSKKAEAADEATGEKASEDDEGSKKKKAAAEEK